MNQSKRNTILYVHANNTDVGGADYCLFKLAAQLDRKKFRPIVCLARKTEILGFYKKEGIQTYVIDMQRIKKSFNLFYLAKLLGRFFPTVNAIRKIIRDENVDMVHGNDLLDIYGPVAGILEKKPTTQYVRWILDSPGWLKAIITRFVYGLNDRVLTVSDGVARSMFSKRGRVRPKVITCYDWIDMQKVGHNQKAGDIRKEFGIPAKASLAGCVGRLEHWKGQEVFIRAAAKVHARIPEARFLVVGGGVTGRGRASYGVRLKRLAEQLGIRDRVIFTGHRSDVGSIMKSLDVFVHSSITPDPLPGVVMEAMYCKTPVVGADAGGVPEEVANNRTGLLYPPGDDDQMAQKIQLMLENPRRAATMGAAGRERVTHVFARRPLCRRIENVYINMLTVNSRNNQGERYHVAYI